MQVQGGGAKNAVMVRPGGGASVTVTVPLVGPVPTFVTLRVKVITLPPYHVAPGVRFRKRDVGPTTRRGDDCWNPLRRVVAGVRVAATA